MQASLASSRRIVDSTSSELPKLPFKFKNQENFSSKINFPLKPSETINHKLETLKNECKFEMSKAKATRKASKKKLYK